MKNRIWMGFILTILCTLMMGVTVFAANTTLKNKKWVSGAGGSFVDTDKDGVVDDFKSSGKAYYKIKTPKKGYIMVDVKMSKLPKEDEYHRDYGEEWVDCSTKISFLNSSKKELEEYTNSIDGEKRITFSAAVKKGTYYLALEGDQKYKVRYIFTKVGKLSKTTTDTPKAPVLKKGVTAKNLLFSNQWAHFYKIKLSEKTKIKISLGHKIRGSFTGFNLQLIVKKGKKYRFVTDKGKLVSADEVYGWWDLKEKDKITATLPKGTYYIKVYAAGASGYYTLKW